MALNRLGHDQIPLKVVKEYALPCPTMRLFVGKLKIATFRWYEPLLPGGEPCWWMLTNSDSQFAGFTDDEAILYALTKLGYM